MSQYKDYMQLAEGWLGAAEVAASNHDSERANAYATMAQAQAVMALASEVASISNLLHGLTRVGPDGGPGTFCVEVS